MLRVETPRARARKIAAVAASKYGVTPADLFSRSRRKPCVQARAHVARELRDGMGWSYPHIGRFLQRDHTSVMWMLGRLAKITKRGKETAVKTIPPIPVARPDLAAVSPAYAEAVKALERVARETGFGDTYNAAFSLVQREARKAAMLKASAA